MTNQHEVQPITINWFYNNSCESQYGTIEERIRFNIGQTSVDILVLILVVWTWSSSLNLGVLSVMWG